jgi:prepilin-type N-terminal cleavage/methylation domain-containing protein
MTPARGQDGFSLIEVLVSMLMAGVVFGATLTILEVFQRNSQAAIQRNETQDAARSAVDRLAHELRSVAAPSSTSPGALEQAEPYAITFQQIDPLKTAGGSNANNAMRMRYCLNDSNPANEVLWLQTKRWTSESAPAPPSSTACPDLAGSDWDGATRLVEHVTNRVGGQNRPLFSFGPPGAQAVNQIVSVEPNVYVDVTPGGRPTETQLTTSVALRNENRRPTASFTAVQLGTERHVLLNASESIDPDGLALAYKWWDGNTQLSSSSQLYETPPLKEESVHNFKLEVTDPGGLSSTIEQTVTIK